jgi:hypothetical protein
MTVTLIYLSVYADEEMGIQEFTIYHDEKAVNIIDFGTFTSFVLPLYAIFVTDKMNEAWLWTESVFKTTWGSSVHGNHTVSRSCHFVQSHTCTKKKNRWETYKNWVIWLDEKDPVFVIKCSHRPSATSNFQQ